MAAHTLALAALLALVATANAGNFLLNAGGPNVNKIGFRCDTGKFANGGITFISPRPTKASGGWKDIYSSHRWVANGDLEYKIPVPDGQYTVFLMWAETWTGSGLGVRQFTVKINGKLQSHNGKWDGVLDVWKAAGGLDQPYFYNAGKESSVNGFITVTLGRIAGKNNPMLSGLTVMGANGDAKVGKEGAGSCASDSTTPTAPTPTAPTPTAPTPTAPTPTAPTPTAPTPIAPTPGTGGKCAEATGVTGRYANKNGFVMNVGGPAVARIGFGADNVNYIVESDIGIVAKAPTPVIDNGNWGEPHQNHRYTTGASLTYKIPMPAGKFSIGLLFTESYMNAPGQRAFDIVINGKVMAKAFDVFKANGGKNKPGYKGFGGISSVGGFITIQFKKVVENPFVNGIYISGTGAGTLAIGGPDAGPCATKGDGTGPGGPGPTPPTPTPPAPTPGTGPVDPVKPDKCKDATIETNFDGKHTAHAVAGGPYIETDFKKQGYAKVNLDGTLSHSHYQSDTENGKIVKLEWMWKDPTNPLADKDGVVKVTGAKVSANFPLGVTTIVLLVQDQVCNLSQDTTTVTVNSATLPGAYCYYYDYGSQNPASVPLPVSHTTGPKPQKGLNVGDINFGDTKSFGEFPFKANAFAVRCQFFLDVKTAGELQYKVIHSGPVKVYHAGALVGSSDSKSANQMTITKKENNKVGLQEWQILYFRPKSLEAKLVFQFSNGAVIPASTVRHDSGSTLPVVIGLSPSTGVPEQLMFVFGTAFVNGVKVKFGSADAVILEGDAGKVQVRAPPGSGKVPVTVTTEAGVSNSFTWTYKDPELPGGGKPFPKPLKFVQTTIKNPNGSPYGIQKIAVVKFGPDGRLYCGATNSKLFALTLDKDLKVTKKCEKDVFEKWPRAVLGLGFDPTKNNLQLFFTTSTIYWKDFGHIKNNDALGWQNGKVKSVTMAGPSGCFNNDVSDVVTGLPVSNHDHAVQAIEFLPGGKMLVGVGGFTNGGISVPGDKLGGIASNPLSGAIVECSTSGTNIKYSSGNPIQAKKVSGACSIYASGFRNTFAMSYNTNNKLYATDNGPNNGFGLFSTNCVGGQKAAKTIPDKFFLVQKGKCHGHPNINRGKNGSPNECAFENPNCVKPLISGLQSSTNGVVEYRSNIFGFEAKGNVFLSKYTGGNEGRVSRVVLDASGKVAKNGFTNIFWGASGLSIVEGPRGELIMGRVFKNNFIVLQPSYEKPTATSLISVMPRRGPAGGGNTVLVSGHAFGNSPSAKFGMKPCTNVKVIDDESFTCKVPAGSKNGQVKVEVSGTTGVAVGFGFDYWYF